MHSCLDPLNCTAHRRSTLSFPDALDRSFPILDGSEVRFVLNLVGMDDRVTAVAVLVSLEDREGDAGGRNALFCGEAPT